MKVGFVKINISKNKLMRGDHTPDKIKLVQNMPVEEMDDYYEPASELLAKLYTLGKEVKV